jgi:TPR repeat protein
MSLAAAGTRASTSARRSFAAQATPTASVDDLRAMLDDAADAADGPEALAHYQEVVTTIQRLRQQPGSAAAHGDVLRDVSYRLGTLMVADLERQDREAHNMVLDPDRGTVVPEKDLPAYLEQESGRNEQAAKVLKQIRAQQRAAALKKAGRSPRTPPPAPVVTREAALSHFETAAGLGLLEAMVMAGNLLTELHKRGDGKTQGLLGRAAAWYEKAAALGHVDAMFNLASIHVNEARQPTEQSGFHADKQAGVAWFRKAAEAGDAPSLFWLGHAYRVGDGVQANAQKALMYLEAAAEKRHTGALLYVFRMLWGGDQLTGTAPDLARGNKFLDAAVAEQDPEAIATLGFMHYNGDGRSQDYAAAFECFRKAAALGHADAALSLGVMLYRGIGTAVDHKAAFKAYHQAADAGNVEAWRNLARWGAPSSCALAHDDLSMRAACTRKGTA